MEYLLLVGVFGTICFLFDYLNNNPSWKYSIKVVNNKFYARCRNIRIPFSQNFGLYSESDTKEAALESIKAHKEASRVAQEYIIDIPRDPQGNAVMLLEDSNVFENEEVKEG